MPGNSAALCAILTSKIVNEKHLFQLYTSRSLLIIFFPLGNCNPQWNKEGGTKSLCSLLALMCDFIVSI